MSMKTIMRGLVVACCAALGLSAWAADYQLTNATLPQNQSNYDNKTLSLTLPVSAAVPKDTVVTVSTIKIGVADHSNASYASRFADKITINEVTSAAGTYAADTSIGSNAGWITYAFETSVELKVGTAYSVTALNDGGQAIDDFRFRVADYNGLSDSKIITISGDSRYAPFCTVIGTYESTMPSSTFSFTGNANGGSVTGFSIGGEGGNAAKKIMGPAGTQMPMIYYVADNNKWHPWANFNAKTTFTLAAYVNTSLCKPAEGKNGVIWSMGNKTGNRVMLVKSSEGKIKLITASGANITNESTAPAFDEIAGYHLYTASFSTESGLALTVDADTANTQTDATAKTQAANGFQIGSIFEGMQNDKFMIGQNIGVANLIGYDAILTDAQIAILAETYPAVSEMQIKADVDQNTSDKELVLPSMKSEGNHFIGVTNGALTIPANATIEVPHVRCLNSESQNNRATVNIDGMLKVTSESSNPNVWADRGSYKGVLFGHWHGQGTYNVTGTLDAPKTFVQLCYTAEAQTLNVNGGTVNAKGITSNNGSGSISLSNEGIINVTEGNFLGVPMTVSSGTLKVGADVTPGKAITISQDGELNLEIAEGKTMSKSDAGITNAGTLNLKSGTLVIAAGNEGSVNISAGATIKLVVTAAQKGTGYTANVMFAEEHETKSVVFLDTDGTTVLESEGNVLPPAAIDVHDGETMTLDPNNLPTTAVRVLTGGTLDVNGVIDTEFTIILDGGTLKNSGNAISDGTKQTPTIVLTKDSTIVATSNFGSIAGAYGAHDITLNGHKLTKTGANNFWVKNATFVGGGTIDIQAGTMKFDNGIALRDGAVTLNIAAGAKAEFVGTTAPNFATITGAGTLETAAVPVQSAMNSLATEGWTGTFFLKGGNIKPNAIGGNASSKVKLSGVTISDVGGNGNCLSDVEIAGTVTFNNWYGNPNVYKFGKLSGSGDIATSGYAWYGITDTFIFTDGENFTGNISYANVTKGGPCFVIGDAVPAVKPTTNDNKPHGFVYVQSGYTLGISGTYAALNTPNTIAGTLKVKTASATFTDGLTFVEGSKVDLSAADSLLTIPAEATGSTTVTVGSRTIAVGDKLIAWASKPESLTLNLDSAAFALEQKDDGAYVIDAKTPLDIFTETINAAEEGSTVQMPAGLIGCLKIENTNNITLDLNGNTITAATTATIRHEGSGTLTIKDTVGSGKVVNTANAEDMGIAVWARGGSIVIEGGAFENASLYEATVYIGAATASGKTITISGGTFKNVADGKYNWNSALDPIVLNVWNSMEPTAISVTGGSFSSDPANGDDNKGGTFLASGYISTLTEGLYVVTKGATRPSVIEGGSEAQKEAFDTWAAKQTGLTDPSAANINAFILDMPNEATEAELQAKLASLITPEMVQKLAADGATTETTVTIPGYGCATFKFVPVEAIETSAKLFRLKATFVPANNK